MSIACLLDDFSGEDFNTIFLRIKIFFSLKIINFFTIFFKMRIG